MTDRELLNLAIKARGNSYAPYSNYAVGAALLTLDGKIYLGCNVENASFGGTMCAERTALFSAVSAGERSFAAIAIAGGTVGQKPEINCTPCGMCLQVMSEFFTPNTPVILGTEDTLKVVPFGNLFPNTFSLPREL